MRKLLFAILWIFLLAQFTQGEVYEVGETFTFTFVCLTDEGDKDSGCGTADCDILDPDDTTAKEPTSACAEVSDANFPGLWRGSYLIPSTPTVGTWSVFIELTNSNSTTAATTMHFQVVEDTFGYTSVGKLLNETYVDTNDLQTNQGAWITAVGFSTLTEDSNIGIDWGDIDNKGSTVDLSVTNFNLVDTCTAVTNDVNLLDATELQIDNIEGDSNELQLNQTKFITATGFSTLTTSDNIGINWADIDGKTTAVDLSATNFQLVDTASVATTCSDLDAISTAVITADAIATGAIGNAEIAASAIGLSELATGAIDATVMAADAIGSSELATTAVNEIVDQVWNEVSTGHTTAGYAGQQLWTDVESLFDRRGILMSDFDELIQNDSYKARVYVYDQEGDLTAADSTPKIRILNKSDDEVLAATAMTVTGTGIYTYSYDVGNDNGTGTYTALVNATVDSAVVQGIDFFEVESNPAEVVISVVDNVINDITCQIGITNEGSNTQEYYYRWWITNTSTGQYEDGLDSGSASKSVDVDDTYYVNKTMTLTVTGTHYCKVEVFYGTEISGASEQFTASTITLDDACDTALDLLVGWGPSETTDFIIKAYSALQHRMEPENQTEKYGIFNVTNQNNQEINLLVYANESWPSGITVFADDDNGFTGSSAITTTPAAINVIDANGEEYTWFWVNYDLPTGAANYTRNLMFCANST